MNNCCEKCKNPQRYSSKFCLINFNCPCHTPSLEPKDKGYQEYDETVVSFCPHCFSSTHTIINESKVGDFCGKCGKDKTEPKDKGDWIKEFDERFPSAIKALFTTEIPEEQLEILGGKNSEYFRAIKSFISTTLKAERERLIGEKLKKIEELPCYSDDPHTQLVMTTMKSEVQKILRDDK